MLRVKYEKDEGEGIFILPPSSFSLYLSGSGREDPLQRDTKIEGEVRLQVVMRLVAASGRNSSWIKRHNVLSRRFIGAPRGGSRKRPSGRGRSEIRRIYIGQDAMGV